jgi:tetraacyldisaccharide 4'-kinase
VRLIQRVWSGDSATDRIARAALTPFELVYRGIVEVRNNLYDRGVLVSRRFPIPVVSVGNLTVGGTGKTPIAAWLAGQLLESGRSPAIVLRGYGDDEPLVHRQNNPQVPVIVAADRVAGIAEAAAGGADVAVLDDAFQHRRAARTIDVVLASADAWAGSPRLLPAGPFREPLSGLRRASVVIITRKAAPAERVAALEQAIRDSGFTAPLAVASLELRDLIRATATGDILRVSELAGKSVVAIAAIGNPDAFFAQLREHTARVTPVAFPDHHAFTDAEIAELARRGSDADYVVCTLKDAVKLGARWPAGARPLWYVSLAVRIERGAESIHELLSRL